jgi:hypothetical protein
MFTAAVQGKYETANSDSSDAGHTNVRRLQNSFRDMARRQSFLESELWQNSLNLICIY